MEVCGVNYSDIRGERLGAQSDTRNNRNPTYHWGKPLTSFDAKGYQRIREMGRTGLPLYVSREK